jgi:TRAP-type C4-dicarboxylate transport system permease small subunit
MELSSPMSQRARIISRIIAITMLCFGFLALWLTFKSLTHITISTDSIFVVLFSGIFFAFSFVTLQLARKFWGQPAGDDIKKLAWVGAFLVFGGAGIIFAEMSNITQEYFGGYEYLVHVVNNFFALCTAGIGFMLIKKIISRLLEIPIQEDWQKKIEARKTYFAILAFFLWGGIWAGLHEAHQKLQLSEQFFGYDAVVTAGILLAAMAFYYVCVSIFCKRKSNTDSSN